MKFFIIHSILFYILFHFMDILKNNWRQNKTSYNNNNNNAAN